MLLQEPTPSLHDGAAHGSRHLSPFQEGCVGAVDRRVDVVGIVLAGSPITPAEIGVRASYGPVTSAGATPIVVDLVADDCGERSRSYSTPARASSRAPSSVRLDWKMPAADRGRKSS